MKWWLWRFQIENPNQNKGTWAGVVVGGALRGRKSTVRACWESAPWAQTEIGLLQEHSGPCHLLPGHCFVCQLSTAISVLRFQLLHLPLQSLAQCWEVWGGTLRKASRHHSYCYYSCLLEGQDPLQFSGGRNVTKVKVSKWEANQRAESFLNK